MKKRGKWRSIVALVAVLVPLTLLATACGGQSVNTGADNIACVYDGSTNGGQRLKHIVQPGEHYRAASNDEVVLLPTSNRFFMASEDQNRDTLAPTFYLGTAQDGVRVRVQGQVRFRFNLALACDWYAKHGRRNATNGDLGFNARGRVAQANAGWFRFLAENFGVTMRDVVASETNAFNWASLTYDYPSGSDPKTGLIATGHKRGDPLRLIYGNHLGQVFTERLKSNLGDNYFCGIDTSVGSGNCPPMVFQVIDVAPVDNSLVTDREATERLRQEAQNAQQIALIHSQTQKSLLADQKGQQRLAKAKLQTAFLNAQGDPAIAKCLALAKAHLVCLDAQPTYVIPGVNGTAKTGG